MTTLPAAETALLDLVRAYEGGATFDEANSSIEDWLALDAPGTEVAAVIEMAGETEEGTALDGHRAFGYYYERHQIGLWVCVKRGTGDGGDGEIRAACKALTEAIKDYIRRYERLGSASVQQARIARTSAPALISRSEEEADATHDAQMITFVVLCRAALDPVEVAAA